MTDNLFHKIDISELEEQKKALTDLSLIMSKLSPILHDIYISKIEDTIGFIDSAQAYIKETLKAPVEL
jgi:hypothetical protein